MRSRSCCSPPRRGFRLLLHLSLAVAAASIERDDSALYEAFAELRALSQHEETLSLQDATPTVVICGRQTDGKSALLEALMGFQFNHVGGGTKTRRPIALQMQYHPLRDEPACYLLTTAGEQPLELAELQAYIERENDRLERVGAFSAEEIVVRIEYRHCPNLSLVDTPGLLVGGPAAEDGGGSDDDTSAEATADSASASDSAAASTSRRHEARARLQAAGVEQLVRSKIKPQEAIVLCVEETSNWDVAAAREVVGTVDRGFGRTVIVATKLDTKFGQFGSAADLRSYLDASSLCRRHPQLLGGPFFTSVPAGRVGSTPAHAFASNGAFRDALTQQEATDEEYVAAVLNGGHAGAPTEPRTARVGVRRLRTFLEALLRERYVAALHRVMPSLAACNEKLERQLRATDASLNELSEGRLRESLRTAVEEFVEAVQCAVAGTGGPAAARLGQTLAVEEAEAAEAAAATRAGTHGADTCGVEGAGGGDVGLRWVGARGVATASAGDFASAPRPANEQMCLAGGAAFYRLLEQFRLAVLHLPLAKITEEEITNFGGLAGTSGRGGAFANGRSRALTAIALRRCVEQVRPLFAHLRVRLAHLLRRLALHAQRRAFDDDADAFAASGLAGREEVVASGGAACLGSPLVDALASAYDRVAGGRLAQCMCACEAELDASPDRLTRLGCGPALGTAMLADARGGATGDQGEDARGAAAGGAAASAISGGGRGEGVETDALLRHSVLEFKRRLTQATCRLVHSHLLLELPQELRPALSADVVATMGKGGAAGGVDVPAARAHLQSRRTHLAREKARVSTLLHTFRAVSRTYAKGATSR